MQGWIAVTPASDADTTFSTPLTTFIYDVDERSKKQVAVNDLLFLRDQKRLLMVARVDSVSAASREQTVLACPRCGIGDINVRKRRAVRYRCFHGHQFNAPAAKFERTITYKVDFVQDCVQVAALIEPAELRPFEFTNGRHLRLKLGDIAGLCGYVARRDHKLAPVLKSWLRNRTVELGDGDANLPALDPLLNIDEQEKPFQAIRLRRGLASFREKLIKRYGARCMISGCSVLALLEAANVSRYQRPEDNHPANGILLRSDRSLINFDQWSSRSVVMWAEVREVIPPPGTPASMTQTLLPALASI